jgi:hypothetical protein
MKVKAAIGLVLALVLTLSVVPAIVGDHTFHAFSTLSATEQASLAPLPDDQLAAVEGAARRGVLIISVQVAVQPQINVCAVCEDVLQTNIGGYQ